MQRVRSAHLAGGSRRHARRDVAMWCSWAVLLAAVVAVSVWALHILLALPTSLLPWALLGLAAMPAAAFAAFRPGLRRRAGPVLAATAMASGLLMLPLGVYLVVVVGFADGLESSQRRVVALSLLATVIVAALVGPTQARLAELTDAVVGATRRPGRTAVEAFGSRMTRAVPMDELLRQLAETLRSGLGPAGAEVWTGSDGVLERTVSVPDRGAARVTLSDPEVAAVAGATVSGPAWVRVWLPVLLDSPMAGECDIRVAPVTHQGQLLGLLVVLRGPADLPFSAADERTLAALAPHLGVALHNLELDTALQASLEELRQRNAELRASRTRIVAAADESRRRIERDIHDGVQQRLMAVVLTLRRAQHRLDRHADSVAAGAVSDAAAQLHAALEELRALARGIHPPLLSERGLAAAVRSLIDHAGLPITLESDLDRRLPPVTEVAGYFVIAEALTNAAKHSQASKIDVRLADRGGALVVEVDDDGIGGADAGTGTGLRGLADRVAAADGTLEIDSPPGGGTRLRADLPHQA